MAHAIRWQLTADFCARAVITPVLYDKQQYLDVADLPAVRVSVGVCVPFSACCCIFLLENGSDWKVSDYLPAREIVPLDSYSDKRIGVLTKREHHGILCHVLYNTRFFPYNTEEIMMRRTST